MPAQVALPCGPLWGKLAMMAIMVPVLASWLDAEWSGRVETSDAAPCGHGRAWATFPQDTALVLARFAD
eukprot:5524037-Heterocapsa_arctica.AAC.1